MVFIIILEYMLMKTNTYKVQFMNYRNFQAYRRKLKGTPYKWTESTRKCVVSPIKNVVDYKGSPFTLGLRDKEPQDFFIGLYTIEYKTELRILPA